MTTKIILNGNNNSSVDESNDDATTAKTIPKSTSSSSPPTMLPDNNNSNSDSKKNKPTATRKYINNNTDDDDDHNNNNTKPRSHDPSSSSSSDDDSIHHRHRRRRSSSPSSSSNDSSSSSSNIQLAMDFLSHPSISTLSSTAKTDYLRSKGLSSRDIRLALKRSKGRRRRRRGRGRGRGDETNRFMASSSGVPPAAAPSSYPPPLNDDDRVPSVALPMTVGAMMAVVGMASWRWLNGEDFILFPTTTTTAAVSIEEDATEDHPIVEDDEEEIVHDDDETNPQQQQQQQDESLNESVALLTQKIDNLTHTLNEFIEKQHQSQRRQLTDKTMSFLRDAATHDEDQQTKYDTNNNEPSPPPAIPSATPLKSSPSRPTFSPHPIQSIIHHLLTSNTPSHLADGLPMLHLYVTNLKKFQSTPRYRKILTKTNEVYKKKVRVLEGVQDFLTGVGFVWDEEGDFWEYKEREGGGCCLGVASDLLGGILRGGIEEAIREVTSSSSEVMAAATRGPPPLTMAPLEQHSAAPCTPCTTTDGIISPPPRKKQIDDTLSSSSMMPSMALFDVGESEDKMTKETNSMTMTDEMRDTSNSDGGDLKKLMKENDMMLASIEGKEEDNHDDSDALFDNTSNGKKKP